MIYVAPPMQNPAAWIHSSIIHNLIVNSTNSSWYTIPVASTTSTNPWTTLTNCVVQNHHTVKSILETLAFCSPKAFNKFIFEMIKNRWDMSYETTALEPDTDDEATIILNDNADIYIEKIHEIQPGFTLPMGVYNLPGGAKLHINPDNSYRIDDRNHRTTYKANPERNFNRYMNASDVLEDFVKYIATLNLSQSEFMELPLRLFVWWLVIEAAKYDEEIPPEDTVIQLERSLVVYKKEAAA